MLTEKQKKSFYDRIVKTDSCWIWEGYRRPDGYGCVRFSGKSYLTHRLSWMLKNGPIPKGKYILHKCDNPPCVNPNHLFCGTAKDNMQDMWNKGRGNPGNLYGEAHPLSKLTETQVIEIRLSKQPLHLLAKKYGVSPTTITDIQKGKIWKHLPYDERRAGNNKSHKLTEEDVISIRGSNESSKVLALKYGVTTRNISDVRYGHTWKELSNAQKANSVKLTEGDVILIRSSEKSGVSLSREFGVSQQTICDIKKRRSWKHI